MTGRCEATVFWWDVETEYRCVRPDGHNGPHRDGVVWFDDNGQRMPGAIESKATQLSRERRKLPAPTGPHQCDHCDKESATLQGLAAHRYRAHGLKWGAA